MSTYSDEYSDDQEETLPVPIVDIKTEKRRGSPRRGSPRRTGWNTDRTDHTQEDDYSDDDYSDDYESEEEYSEEEISSPRRSGRGTSRPADIRPPDELLTRSEKKAQQMWKKSKSSRAITELVRCTALARIVHGDGSWQQAWAHAQLARAYFELKGLAPQAQEHAETAKTLILRSVQVSQSSAEKAQIMKTLATIFYTLGRAQATLKKLTDAEASLQKAEKIVEERSKLPTVKSDDTQQWQIDVSRALAKVYGAQKKHANAMSYYDKVIDLLEAAYGPDCAELVPVYQEDGRLLQIRDGPGDKDAAVQSFLEAHSIACSVHGEGSEIAADTALSLSRAYSALNTEEAESSAEQYLTSAIASYQTIHGPEHKKSLDAQDEQVRLMIRTDRSQEACALMKSILPAKRQCFGDLSVPVAETYKLLASVILSTGDMTSAAKVYQKCYDVETSVYGANHRKTKETKDTLDVLMKDPSVKSRVPKSKSEELNSRPRFNGIVKTTTSK